MALLALYMLWLCVCPSVCLFVHHNSQASVISTLQTHKQCRIVVQDSSFLMPKIMMKFHCCHATGCTKYTRGSTDLQIRQI